ncbi:unnamed protein product, partial [Ixodes persulcatus]
MLGRRTAIKADLECSAAELVYGTTLRLPGDFFCSSAQTTMPDPLDYSYRLRAAMQAIKSCSPREQRQPRVFVSPDLATSSHVFARRDAVRKPLQHPYDGPFKIVHRGPKHFTLDIKNKEVVVSLDRLKPAYIDEAIPKRPSS